MTSGPASDMLRVEVTMSEQKRPDTLDEYGTAVARAMGFVVGTTAFERFDIESANSISDSTPVFMSTDAATRKKMPVASGVLNYFPDALKCVAWVSRVGNDQHNPGQPLHWAKEKSQDEADAGVRHLIDHLTGAPVDAALQDLGEVAHLAQHAWRALANLQRACDAIRARGVK